MRRLFNIAIVVLLGYLIADRAVMHARAGETGAISCEDGAARVKSEARAKGFPDLAADSQAQMFESGCLVTGHAQVGNLIAHPRN